MPSWPVIESVRSKAPLLALVSSAALVAAAALIGIGGSSTARGAAAGPCPEVPRLIDSGRAVLGTACADRIEVTSPGIEKVFGGDGDDVIVANAFVVDVYGEGGDDLIYGEPTERESYGEAEPPLYEPEPPSSPEADGTGEEKGGTEGDGDGESDPGEPVASASSNKVECTASPCYGGAGNQNLYGGAGTDIIFGQRGNDIIHGEAGDDLLYGGIGDDTAYGNQDDDMVSGEMGADKLDGNNGNDLIRGDGTIDQLLDSGTGTDTLSFATGVAPGFNGEVAASGFPADNGAEERGVDVRLDGSTGACGYLACNSGARYGGGNDEITVANFENVIGTPFADRIIGSSRPRAWQPPTAPIRPPKSSATGPLRLTRSRSPAWTGTTTSTSPGAEPNGGIWSLP